MTGTSKVAGIFALVVVCFAANSIDAAQSSEILLSETTMIGGAALEKGSYKLTWKRNGSKDSYLISLHRGGKRVATVDGHAEERPEKQNGGVLFRLDQNGKRVLAEIRLAGKREVIVVDG